ncbi:uncharacterized protein LOC117642829 [Thrips palmi]|uniref:Uncharacterized protein LOC117642829 n=1 Tax=Thrips palmi TaxID=161013 RepID=A0A6P8YJT6_THRPL|nr:uncharacterized protein LOC117642829 [Thrips palmi]XP_034237295.1 uncharacterized protein LOC117642829 [Thrips palmi]
MDIDSTEDNYHATTSQHAPSPDMFSSEDEETYKIEDELSQSAPVSPTTETAIPEEKDLVVELESARLQRLMALLQGVPPPPSVTIPQITLNEVLKKLRENNDQLFGPNDTGGPVHSLWKPNASLKEVLNAEWPEIKKIVYHDMHFNTCTASEDVEHISLKLHERLIGAETSTWCNAVTSSVPISTRQRQRRSMGNTSPGCRLSHLARRRQTFSSANLAQLSSVAGSGTAGGAHAAGSSLGGTRRRSMNGAGSGNERRCIMVEIKKTDKNKRIKTNSKEAMKKLSSSGNAPKAAAPVQDPVQSLKRALFQSPEEHKRMAASSSNHPSSSESNNVQRSKRALWPSEREAAVNDNGKRTLDKSDSLSSQRSKMHCSDDRAPYIRTTRSLPFPVGQNSNSSSVSNPCHSSNSNSIGSNNKSARRASDQGPPAQEYNLNTELSELHKRKLYWAITSALRSHGINNRTHSDFIQITSDLAYHYIKVRANMTGPPPASTSEHMLQVVTAKAAEVIQAVRAGKTGQEENLGGNKVQRKEERPNKELFRDATASLNVRRSLCVSLSTSNHQLSDDKPKQTKRVPSARKSLSFDAIDPRPSSGTLSDEPAEKGESKYQLDSKGNDSKWKVNGENVPLASAKRVSRSLFLSPKDDVKTTKKDACEQTCGSDNKFNSIKQTCEEAMDIVDHKSEEMKKSGAIETSEVDDRHPHTSSEVSSIPSVSAESSTLEADNEASRTSEATNLSEHANSVDASTNLALLQSNTVGRVNGLLEKSNVLGISDNLKVDSGSSESCEYAQTRVLRDTKERVARHTVVPARRITRLSLSLSRRELRSSSSDSTDQDPAPTSSHLDQKATLLKKGAENNLINIAHGVSTNLVPTVVLSPLKLEQHHTSESNNTSKSTFGSPPFIVDSSLTPAHSPFLGFPSKDDLNSSGEAADGSDSTTKADGTSDEGNLSRSEAIKIDIEEKVITPLLEGAVLESSVCVGSGSSPSTDVDLSFRGRIESLKPSIASETAISLDLGMNLNVSANILNMDENHEKSPVLEKWAERASRSAQKSCIPVEEVIDTVAQDVPLTALQKPTDHSAEESILQWEESQYDGTSQCSTNMYEKFCSIFGPSSHQGNP